MLLTFELERKNYVLNVTDSLLDLVLANFRCRVSADVAPLVPVTAYHTPLRVELKTRSCEISFSKREGKYNFKKANYLLVYGFLLNTDWPVQYKFTEVS